MEVQEADQKDQEIKDSIDESDGGVQGDAQELTRGMDQDGWDFFAPENSEKKRSRYEGHPQPSLNLSKGGVSAVEAVSTMFIRSNESKEDLARDNHDSKFKKTQMDYEPKVDTSQKLETDVNGTVGAEDDAPVQNEQSVAKGNEKNKPRLLVADEFAEPASRVKKGTCVEDSNSAKSLDCLQQVLDEKLDSVDESSPAIPAASPVASNVITNPAHNKNTVQFSGQLAKSVEKDHLETGGTEVRPSRLALALHFLHTGSIFRREKDKFLNATTSSRSSDKISKASMFP